MLALGGFGELIPTSFGKGGMKDLVDKRRKGKAPASSLAFGLFDANNTDVKVMEVNLVARIPKTSVGEESDEAKEVLVLSGEAKQALAEHIQDQTRWACPIFISAVIASSWALGNQNGKCKP